VSGGWFAGCEQVALGLDQGAVNRCLLLTDGLANRGITNPDELTGHVTALRERGVSTTTFGVGNDFDEVLLQAMADAGGGHFYYIADGAQIRDHIASEVGETLEVTAHDVAVEIVHPEGVRVEAISPQRVEGRGSRTIVAVGDLVADQLVEVVLRLTFPYSDLGRETGVIVAVAGAAGEGQARLAWTYADDASNDRQARDVEVDRAVARQFAARARQEAVGRNRARDYGEARRALDATARRIRGYAHRDQELRRLVDELESEAQQFSAPVAASRLKEVHFASASMAHSRDAAGRAMRRPGRNASGAT
jgi:Ca-activated chloride channel family protein